MKPKFRTCIRWGLVVAFTLLMVPIEVRGEKKWLGPDWTGEIIVSTPKEFQRALVKLRPGQAISLRPGVYDELHIHGVRGNRSIVIRSHDPHRPAQIQSLRVRDSERLWFDNLLFAPVDGGRPATGSLVDIRDSWAIGMVGNTIRGSVDDNHLNDPAGVRILRTDEVLFAENRLHDLSRGVILGGVRRARISRNRFTVLRSDGANLASVQDVVIDGNFFAGLHPARSDTAGFIRFWQRSSLFEETRNVIIRDNVLLQGSGSPARGIVVGNQVPGSAYRNFTIEDNIVYVSAANGISLYDLIDGRVANNTLVAYPGGAGASRIGLVRTRIVAVVANVASGLDQEEATDTTLEHNILTEGTKPGMEFHPVQLFSQPAAGPDATASSFLPRPGGPLDRGEPQRIGARLRADDWPKLPRLTAGR